MYNYHDAQFITVSKEEAIAEILQHGDRTLVKEFFFECGEKNEYEGKEVLDFLGY